jgi:hypothetical protein
VQTTKVAELQHAIFKNPAKIVKFDLQKVSPMIAQHN